MTTYKVIGTRPIRHDGVDKVTGRALYGADVQMTGLLHGRILRSPYAHARIKKIDASEALILHDKLVTESLADKNGSKKPTNIAKHIQFVKGDVDKGFKDAAVVVEREFHTATVHQGYIEPHNATAVWTHDGHLTVWCST